MNKDLADACVCYGLYDEEKIIGFMGVLLQPSTNKNLKRVSRLVILPDYQGIGLGTKFLEFIAKEYIRLGYDFSIITSAKNLIGTLRKSDKWCMYRYSIVKDSDSKKSKIDGKIKHRKCYTASFMYKK